MQVFYEKNISNLNINNSAVALGSFESLHIGHMDIIKRTVKCAEKHNIKSVVTIFKEPILKSRKTACETFDKRLEILKKAKVDYVVVFEFTDEFKALSPEEFFNRILIDKLKASYLFVGFNYHFGNMAKGDTTLLKKLCNNSGIELSITPPVKTDRIISSTYIYDLITSGDIKKLNASLGRPYSISGTVTKGRHLGSSMGFPTANIEYPLEKAIINEGVYYGKCFADKNEYHAIINVGKQPTVTKDNTPRIEAHLLDFQNNIYGTEIKLDFYEKIREIKKFKNIDELKEQLNCDILFCRNITKNEG